LKRATLPTYHPAKDTADVLTNWLTGSWLTGSWSVRSGQIHPVRYPLRRDRTDEAPPQSDRCYVR